MAMKFDDDFFRQIAFDPGVVSMAKKQAEEVADRARASAPVDTGAYRDSIHVERDDTPFRPLFRVIADDPKSIGVESQTGNLARAVRGRRA